MIRAAFIRSGASRIFALGIVVLMLLGGFAVMPQSAKAVDAGTVTVRLHSCPAGFDGINATLSQLALSCTTPMGGVDFAIQYAGLAPSHQTDLDGSWQLTGVTAGAVTISEFPPDPSLLIRASCSQFDVSTGVNNYQEAPVGQGSATWNLQAGQAIDCDWFNFPVVTPTQTTVSIRLHGCPDGFDGINADIYGFAQYCHTPIGGVDFTVQYAGLAPSHQTDLDGTWTFTDVTTGVITLTEARPDPSLLIRAFCSQFNASGAPSNYLEAPVGQGSATWTLQPGQALDCDWYNFPATTGTTPPSGTAATVTIRKHVCDDGYDASSGSIYDLAANCNSPLSGITFTIAAVNGPPRGGQTGADGSITWQNIPAGQITVQEQKPAQYDVIRVFCNQRKLTGEEVGFQEITVSSDDSITDVIQNGYDEYDCDWFNASSPSNLVAGSPTAAAATPSNSSGNASGNQSVVPVSGSIAINVYTCPKGYNSFANGADPKTDCSDATGNIQFTLKPSSGASIKQKTGDDGGATFANLNAGTYQLTEAFPSGVTSAFIWTCTSTVRDFNNYPFLPFARLGSSGLLGINLQAGEQLACHWYDVPSKTAQTTAGGTAITITAFSCPGQSVNLAQCTPAASGVSFTLMPSGGGAATTMATDDSGVATGTLPPGTYTLTEAGSSPCLVDSSAFNQNGDLNVADQPIAVKVYDCGA
jgi:hypothetical protein